MPGGGGHTLHLEVLVAFRSAEAEFFGVIADKDYAVRGVDGVRAHETVVDPVDIHRQYPTPSSKPPPPTNPPTYKPNPTTHLIVPTCSFFSKQNEQIQTQNICRILRCVCVCVCVALHCTALLVGFSVQLTATPYKVPCNYTSKEKKPQFLVCTPRFQI